MQFIVYILIAILVVYLISGPLAPLIAGYAVVWVVLTIISFVVLGFAAWRESSNKDKENRKIRDDAMHGWHKDVDKDKREAMRWLRKAAEQGDAEAQTNLGDACWKGEGVDNDLREAVHWWRKAAVQGYTKAQYNLAGAYLDGRGVDKDKREAVRWWRKGAKQGYDLAQNDLGDAYWRGQGVTMDKREAVRWWSKAVVQGHSLAQNNLNAAYRLGEGVDKDLREAVHWYRKESKHGNQFVLYDLGWAYLNDENVIVTDERDAYIWLSIAKANGDKTAEENLRKVNWHVHLSQNEIDSADKEVARCLEKLKAIENRRAR